MDRLETLPNKNLILLHSSSSVYSISITYDTTNKIHVLTQTGSFNFGGRIASLGPAEADNTKDDVFFVLGSNNLQRFVVTGSSINGLTSTHTVSDDGLDIRIVYSTAKAYVLTYNPNTYTYKIYDSLDLTLLNTQVFTMTNAAIFRGEIAVVIHKSKLYITFGYVDSSTPSGQYNFKVVELDNCPVGCPLCISATTCDSTCTSYYKEPGLTAGTFICYTKETVPDGKGVNPSTGLLESCTDVNCKRCEDDYQICVQCVQDTVTPLTRFLLDSPSYSARPVCVDEPLPEGYGEVLPRALDNPKASRCSIANCKLCTASHLVCTECFASFYYDGLTATKACVTFANLRA